MTDNPTSTYRASAWRDPVTEAVNLTLARRDPDADDQWHAADGFDCTTRRVEYQELDDDGYPSIVTVALLPDEAHVIIGALANLLVGPT